MQTVPRGQCQECITSGGRMVEGCQIENDVEEFGGCLIVILSLNLLTGTEKNHEEAQKSQCSCRYPNQTLIGYEFRARLDVEVLITPLCSQFVNQSSRLLCKVVKIIPETFCQVGPNSGNLCAGCCVFTRHVPSLERVRYTADTTFIPNCNDFEICTKCLLQLFTFRDRNVISYMKSRQNNLPYTSQLCFRWVSDIRLRFFLGAYLPMLYYRH